MWKIDFQIIGEEKEGDGGGGPGLADLPLRQHSGTSRTLNKRAMQIIHINTATTVKGWATNSSHSYREAGVHQHANTATDEADAGHAHRVAALLVSTTEPLPLSLCVSFRLPLSLCVSIRLSLSLLVSIRLSVSLTQSLSICLCPFSFSIRLYLFLAVSIRLSLSSLHLCPSPLPAHAIQLTHLPNMAPNNRVVGCRHNIVCGDAR